jgi:hypothetical protein
MAAVVSALLVLLMAGSEQAGTQQWIAYHNTPTGLSLRYPPCLRLHEFDGRTLGLLDTDLVVDLVGDTKMNPGTVVLRFIVNRGLATPQIIASESRDIRGGAKSVTTMLLDGHEALVAVSCGRAACHWQVHILQPRKCTILSLLGGTDLHEADFPPHDGFFPLLSIIKTVHFQQGGERNQ